MDKKQVLEHFGEDEKLALAAALKERYGIELIELDKYPDNKFFKPSYKRADGKIKAAISMNLYHIKGSIEVGIMSFDETIRKDDKFEYFTVGDELSEADKAKARQYFKAQSKFDLESRLETAKTIKVFGELDKIERLETNKLLKQKKLKIPKTSQAFVAKEITIQNANGDDRLYSDCLVVPYYHPESPDRPVGLQVRLNGGVKLTQTGSMFKNGTYSIVQEGKELYDLGITNVIITESWTTGCALAMALGEDFRVICGAGKNTIEDIHKSYVRRDDAERFNIIHALDKTEKDEPRDMTIEDFKAKLNKDGYSHIQLPKAKEDGYYEFTDFGDVLKNRGLPSLQKFLQGKMRLMLPVKPELIGHNDKSFFIKVPWSIEVKEEAKYNVLDSSYIPPIYCYAYSNAESFLPLEDRNADRIKLIEAFEIEAKARSDIESGAIKKDEYGKQMQIVRGLRKKAASLKEEINKKRERWIIKDFEGQAQLAKERGLKGVGTFIENGIPVLNTNRGRFVYRDGKLEYTDKRMPVGDDRYANMCDDKPLDITDAKFTRKTADDIKSKWMSLYGTESNIRHYELLIGYNVLACYASLLDRRANIWCTGASGSGKSTSYRAIISQLFQPYMYSKSDTTLAGLIDGATQSGSIEASDSIRIEESGSRYGTTKYDNLTAVIEHIKDNTDSQGGETQTSRSNSNRTHVSRSLKSCYQLASVNIRPKLGLEFISRLCLIPFEQDDLSSKVPLIKKITKECAALQPHILDLIGRGAPLIQDAIDSVNDEVVNLLKDDMRGLSHKTITLSSIIAGYVVFELVADNSTDVKGYTKKIVQQLGEQIHKQVKLQREHLNESSSFLTNLNSHTFRTGFTDQYVTVPGGSFIESIVHATLDEERPQIKDKYIRDFKVWVNVKGDRAELRFHTRDISDMKSQFKSNMFIDKLFINETELGELAATPGTNIKRIKSLRKPNSKGISSGFAIDITDVYERMKDKKND